MRSWALVFYLALTPALAQWSGNLALQGRWFTQSAVKPDAVDDNLSLSAEPQWVRGLGRDDEISFRPFLRLDGREGRQHADIRELRWLHVGDNDEWRIGIDSVFWGVTESRHLVDVINSIDHLEGIDGEDKLGQPMIHYSYLTEDGAIEAFLLPGFRPAHYGNDEARLTPWPPLRESLATYESPAEEHHVDVALRYNASLGDHELGLSVFRGTQREPELRPLIQNGQPVALQPWYPQMTQWGLDLQSILDDWIWKLEAIRRQREDGDFHAYTAGFEYSFYGVFGSAADLGWLMEYSHDQRPGSIFDDDLFAGLRLALNDVQSSELLAGLLYDRERHSRSLRVEASRRLGSSWKLSLEAQAFSHIASDDPLYGLRRDDYLQLELAYYF